VTLDQQFHRYHLLASAIAGQLVEVAPIDAGSLAWTDGATIFVAADLSPSDVLRTISVQASLLAANSLAPDILTELERRTALTQRYLMIEGHRALIAQDDLLPHAARALIDLSVIASGSSGESLGHAVSRAHVPSPPPLFGTIRPRAIRAKVALRRSAVAEQVASPEMRVDEMNTTDSPFDDGPAFEASSAWVGRGGAIGRLLKRFLDDARTGGSGPPGSNATARWTHGSTRTSAARSATVRTAFDADTGTLVTRANQTFVYPEWDAVGARYRRDWCTVVEVEADARRDGADSSFVESRALRRPLARVGLGVERRHRQLQGDDVDLDAAVEGFAARVAGHAPDDACYIDSIRRARDLSVLVLLDVSGSANERSVTGPTVHDHQRAVAASLTFALNDLGDRVALYGFRSLGRAAVHVVPLKRFDEHLDASVVRRLDALTPGAYTRLGAAIRHGAATLESHGGTPRRLLVVISDGFAYDHGYEGDYGEADARRALAEARRRGIGCLCISVGVATDPDVLRRVFGTAAHASLAHTEQLPAVVGPLFQAALLSAASQQRMWQRAERTRERSAIDRRQTA
jgi:hypothetical protein